MSSVVQYITVVDEDDNHYHIVKIGEQIWMAENLKTSKYNDGTEIPLVTGEIEWANLTTPGYCLYDNSDDSYGALYNWYTVNTDKLCPAGWHVPSDGEWTELITFVGGESIAGSKLKDLGTNDWIVTTVGVTNEYYFTALPGGDRSKDGAFVFIGTYGFWWSSNGQVTDAPMRSMKANENSVGRSFWDMNYGHSVRCVQD